MKNLVMSEEAGIPTVNFDYSSGVLSMGGSSLPENVQETFAPIIDWLTTYMENPKEKTIFDFDFHYLNTASTNMIGKISVMLTKFYDRGNNLLIRWHFPGDDYDHRDLGSELFEESGCPYEQVPY